MARKPKDGKKTEEWMTRSLDDLSDFEQYRKEIAPKIRELQKKGATAKEMMAFAESYAAARMISLVFSADEAKAMTASKDIIDRASGKATEKSETIHRFENLKEEELDALITSRLSEVEDDTDTDAH